MLTWSRHCCCSDGSAKELWLASNKPSSLRSDREEGKVVYTSTAAVPIRELKVGWGAWSSVPWVRVYRASVWKSLLSGKGPLWKLLPRFLIMKWQESGAASLCGTQRARCRVQGSAMARPGQTITLWMEGLAVMTLSRDAAWSW